MYSNIKKKERGNRNTCDVCFILICIIIRLIEDFLGDATRNKQSFNESELNIHWLSGQCRSE